eukprot:CAMPEP_0172169024 /NCGR_PEP_ID=MMETSP1050-20130122/10474_1 /TAXON_ID=233186 /ORGANISM="Cryptomonas curvata, Strain CCAP979/52" /LENGTH=300 /DNA_ID=CAMNT_0012840033 /DNA_START=78 /DNA_END=976 /DNA_ORIENTATION=+
MVKYSDVLLNKEDSIPMPNISALDIMDYRSIVSHFFRSADDKPMANGIESFDQTNALKLPSLKESMDSLGWAHLPLQHYWNIGYQARPILKIIMQLPPRLCLALMRFSDALHYMAQDSTKTLERKILLSGIDSNMTDAPDVSYCQHSDETTFWEEELQHGLIRVEFDPVSQSRKGFNVNTRAAHIWNTSKAELLDRFQACDVPLQLTDIDWIRAFANYLATYFDEIVTQFLRFTTACGGTFNAKLVSTTTTKTFDSVGRISQVRWALRVVSPSEYSTPHACPHVLSGDRRTGQQLLDDAA